MATVSYQISSDQVGQWIKIASGKTSGGFSGGTFFEVIKTATGDVPVDTDVGHRLSHGVIHALDTSVSEDIWVRVNTPTTIKFTD